MIQNCVEFHVLVSCQFAIQARVLKYDSETFPHLSGISPRIQTVDFESSAGGRQQSGQHFDCGALSRSIWSKEGEDLTSSYRERNRIHCRKGSELLCQVLDFDHERRFAILIRIRMVQFTEIRPLRPLAYQFVMEPSGRKYVCARAVTGCVISAISFSCFLSSSTPSPGRSFG